MDQNKHETKSRAHMVEDEECGHLITLYGANGRVVAQWGCTDWNVAHNLMVMLNHSGVHLYEP